MLEHRRAANHSRTRGVRGDGVCLPRMQAGAKSDWGSEGASLDGQRGVMAPPSPMSIGRVVNLGPSNLESETRV